MKPCPSVHQPTWNTEHLLCARGFPGPGPAAEPRIWASADRQTPWSQEGLSSPAAPWGSAPSTKQQCSVGPSTIVPFLAPASSQEKSFQISIAVGFQQHLNGLPQARQPQPSRTAGAKTKVGPGTPSCCPGTSRGPWTVCGPECQFHAQEVVEKEEAGSQCALEDSGLTWCPPGESSSCLERSPCPGPPSSGLKAFSCSWYQPRAHLLGEALPLSTCPGWGQVHPGLPRLLCPLTMGKTERDLELDRVGSRPGSAAFICDRKHVT